MHKLFRRVAWALALPLIVGAPVALLASPARAAATSTTTVPSAPSPSAYGQEVRITATVTSGGQPVTSGSVRFQVRDPGSAGYTQFGPSVSLSPSGTAMSGPVTQENGTPMEVTASSGYSTRAVYDPPSGSALVTSMSTPGDQRVDKSGSSVGIQPSASTLVADLAGQLPGGVQEGSAPPTGQVTFTVNGHALAPVDADPHTGRATLAYVLGSGPQVISAAYAGDDRYTASSTSRTRNDPLLSARVLSSDKRSKSGWYRTVVEVLFVCQAQGSGIDDCPGDVTLRKSGRNQTVTRTVHALDGGTATLTLSVDIDRVRPTITMEGRSCTATDRLSGVKGTCHLRVDRNGTYRAVATDKAGNRTVRRGVLD